MAKSSNKLTVRDSCFVALITAACVVGRTAFQFIPNVQPVISDWRDNYLYGKGGLGVNTNFCLQRDYHLKLWTQPNSLVYPSLAAAAGICSFYRLPVWFYNSLRGYANLWNQRFLAVLFARDLF